jgi:uncharacterized membrane protein HdeD (DUF308 family)
MTKWFARNHKLAVFPLVEGVIEIVLYLNIKGPNSGWVLFDGIISLILGLLIGSNGHQPWLG